MKRKQILLFSLLCLILIGILISNYQYPFITKKVGKWSVGYNFSENPLKKPEVDSENVISYTFMDSILQTSGNYIADPFFIVDDGQYFLFTELKGKKDADIALFKSVDGKDFIYDTIVLDEPFHLSYPQVFKHEEEFYMLPESKQSGHLLLYKSDNFPYAWKVVDTLLKDVKLKDASILLSEEFNLMVAVDDHMNQLIYTADSLSGDWQEASNYISRKGNHTRPGGRFFHYQNEWYLPVQDRSRGYGSGISLYQLHHSTEHLSLQIVENRYLHNMDSIIWFNRGMHHLDLQRVNNSYYMVYDGDRNLNGENSFQIRRTLKFIYSDIYNYTSNSF